MKQREQALLLLRKAAQDEALIDQVLRSDKVSDEIIGFHCQQAAEKLLKAPLSDLGIRFRKTHEIGALLDLLANYGCPARLRSSPPMAWVRRPGVTDSGRGIAKTGRLVRGSFWITVDITC